MILILNKDTITEAVEALLDRLHFMGFEARLEIQGNDKAIVILNGVDDSVHEQLFKNLASVEKVIPFKDKFKLAGRDLRKKTSVFDIRGRLIGGDEFIVMAGPCSIESREQVFAIAEKVSQAGASILRGGAFKPRTSPYEFQGLGEQGLRFLREAADAFDLLCISEVMNTEDIALVAEHVDILQLGARNMQNYGLLRALGKAQKPVLLKRGLSATYKEFLLAAEYIMSSGNPQVILCERGIRTFETYTRNTLDIAAVPILRELTHLPIIVDPSHAVGLRQAVPALAKAALAVQADGLLIEVHTDPDRSISDAAQTISTETFAELMQALSRIALAVDRRIKAPQLEPSHEL